MSFFRINRYPPCPRPDLALGVGHHKDADVISLLAQDEVGGLQISRRSDGVWFPIRPVPNALVINIGNCMEVKFFILYRILKYINLNIEL